MDKSAKVLMVETVTPTPDRMFVEIRYKSLYMETYMVKQIISPSENVIKMRGGGGGGGHRCRFQDI